MIQYDKLIMEHHYIKIPLPFHNSSTIIFSYIFNVINVAWKFNVAFFSSTIKRSYLLLTRLSM